MHQSHTPLSRAAAAGAGVLAMALLVVALVAAEAPAYARVVVLATCLVTSSSALALFRHNSFASRLGAVVTALLSAGGAVLVGTAGLPGAGSPHVTGTGVGIAALALALALALVVDSRRRAATGPCPPPYAL